MSPREAMKLEIFVELGRNVMTLSKCKRARVGTVIFPLDYSRVAAIGYNGPARGMLNESCHDEPHLCGCAHAESNALVKLNPALDKDLVMFTTTTPCPHCAALIVNSQTVCAVIYDELYSSGLGDNILDLAKIPRFATQMSNVAAELALLRYGRDNP